MAAGWFSMHVFVWCTLHRHLMDNDLYVHVANVQTTRAVAVEELAVQRKYIMCGDVYE